MLRRLGRAAATAQYGRGARGVSFSAQQRVVAEQLLRTVGSEEDLAVYEVNTRASQRRFARLALRLRCTSTAAVSTGCRIYYSVVDDSSAIELPSTSHEAGVGGISVLPLPQTPALPITLSSDARRISPLFTRRSTTFRIQLRGPARCTTLRRRPS